MIRLTLGQLEGLLGEAKRQREFNAGFEYLKVRIYDKKNGVSILEFEQPCEYPECNSTFYTYEGKNEVKL
jgi:hypothetical protein